MKYSELDVAKVKAAGDIRDFIPGASSTRVTSYVRCPECGVEGKNKGLSVVHKTGKDFAKCFHCGFSLSGAVAACMYYEFNNDKKKYPEAIKLVADRSGVPLLSADEKLTKEVSRQKIIQAKSFCERQLEGSGLTVEDVMVKVKQPNGEYTLEPAFRRGSLDLYGNIRPGDDEMLIYYYRLDGTMEQYATRGARGALRPYIRIRFSNPELHTPKDAKRTCKYLTPKGAPTKFYFPQRIRDAYNEERHIETLVIQEGEKKAEKACKHGVMSIGIQGIYNVGNKEGGLPADLQYIVQRCGVRNVILLMDIIDALDYAQKTNTIGNFKIIEKYSSSKANQFEKQNLVIQNNDKALIKVLNQLDKKLELFSLENQLKKLNKRLDDPFVTINTVTGKYGIKKALGEYEKYKKTHCQNQKKIK